MPANAAEQDSNDRIVVRCGSVRKLLIRPDTYEDAVKLVFNTFILAENSVTLKAKCTDNEQFVVLSEQNWPALRDNVKTMVVASNKKHTVEVVYGKITPKYSIEPDKPLSDLFETVATSLVLSVDELKFSYQGRSIKPSDTPQSLGFGRVATLNARRNIRLCVMSSCGEGMYVVIPYDSPLIKIREAIANKLSCGTVSIKMFYDSQYIADPQTPADFSMERDDVIDYMLEQVGGKPVIYLFPPQPLEATVRLALEPAWRFDTVYPVVPFQDDVKTGQQRIQWSVEASPSGNLRDKDSGTEITYLFWEAKTTSAGLSSSADTLQDFIPGRTHCQPKDSVLLSIRNVTGYLDRTLTSLGLHTSARTDFITYWLPRFLRHKYIALRFLPQKSYEAAAPLEVSPQPDVVTRVFMLFQGVREDQLDPWSEAEARAAEDASFWKSVI
ncbi:hypothetical protein FRB90_006727, partial [Tulasnella sp. 427]